MKSTCTKLNPARSRLARIRCLDECVNCFRENLPLPESLCYIPSEVKYHLTKSTRLPLFEEPNKNSQQLEVLTVILPITPVDKNTEGPHILVTSGEELCNSQGQWAKFIRVCA